MKNIPIYQVFQDADALNLALLRMETFLEFEGSDTARKLFGVTLTPILSYIAYAYWRLTKLRRHLFWFLLMFLFSFFILTYNLAKSPFIFYILGFIFLSVLINGHVKKSTLCFLLGLVLSLILFAYIFFMGASNFEAAWQVLWRRIFLGQSQGTFMAFEYFPKEHDFIGFSSFWKLFPRDLGVDASERAFRVIMVISNPEGVKAGTAGVVTSLFIQEAWANFGLYGVIIAPIYVGMFVQMIYLFFLNFKKTPVAIGVLAYLSYKMPIISGFYHFVFDMALVFVFIFFILIYIVALVLRKIKNQAYPYNEFKALNRAPTS
jgi:oligosaccharide repeat unit polymerase